MVHPYVANTINGLVLLLGGFIAYVLVPERGLALLLAPAFGVLLLACTYHLRKHNRFVFHTVTALTLLVGFVLIVHINPDTFEWNAENVLYLLLGVSCFLAVLSFVATFVQERRLKNNTVYKEDL
ncbi:hypothetical protein [Pontibacter roseus]|uniref:hypothetical protein n=1 Tax=Pontibacter roseus TaxID=336989 RepID=UPI00037630E7|nr:hypothetical protein [Pontibacter roseus]